MTEITRHLALAASIHWYAVTAPLEYRPPEPTRFQLLVKVLRRLGPVGVLFVFASTMPVVGSVFVIGSIYWLAPWMRDHAVAGPSVALTMALVLGGLMFMPTYSFAALCGAAFGPLYGTGIAIVGIVLGGLVNYTWARAVCGDRVIHLIDEKPKLALLHRELIHASPKRTLLLMTLVRIPPGFPFSITNLLVAALKVPLVTVLVSIAIGSIPRTAIVAAASGRLASGSESKSLWTWALYIGSAVLLLAIVGRIGASVLQKVTAQQPAQVPV